MTEQQRAAASALARERLLAQERWLQARSVLFYAPISGELDVWPLLGAALRAGKIAALPRFAAATNSYIACPVVDLERDLEPGRWGIREPVERCAQTSLNRLDLVLVPGVALDMHGGRLGRGKGFYDRLLTAVRGTTCGIAFDEQIVDAVPVEPHDIQLNCILTPTRWIEL